MKFCPKCGRGFLLGIYCVHDDTELVVNQCESCYREYDVDVLHCDDDGTPLPVLLLGPKKLEDPTTVESDRPEGNEKIELYDPSPESFVPLPVNSEPKFYEPEENVPQESLEPEGPSSESDPSEELATPAPVSAFDALENVEDENAIDLTPDLGAAKVEVDRNDAETDEDEYDNDLGDPKEGLTELVKVPATSGEMTFGLVAALICGGCAFWGYDFSTESSWAGNFVCIWICPGFTLLTALFMLYVGFAPRGKAACPQCKEWVTGFFHGAENVHNPELCESCGTFCRGKGYEVWKVHENYVASAPMFHAELVDDFHVPDICCECGAPATRKMGVDWTTSEENPVRLSSHDPDLFKINAGAESGEFMAPHCQRHHSGCELKSTIDRPFSIYVKSHKFHLEFCDLNDTRPGKKD